jgi:hypothetical protein
MPPLMEVHVAPDPLQVGLSGARGRCRTVQRRLKQFGRLPLLPYLPPLREDLREDSRDKAY